MVTIALSFKENKLTEVNDKLSISCCTEERDLKSWCKKLPGESYKGGSFLDCSSKGPHLWTELKAAVYSLI